MNIPKLVLCGKPIYQENEPRFKYNNTKQLLAQTVQAEIIIERVMYMTSAYVKKQEYNVSNVAIQTQHLKDIEFVCYSVVMLRNISVYRKSMRKLGSHNNNFVQYYFHRQLDLSNIWHLFTIPAHLDFYGPSENGMTLPLVVDKHFKKRSYALSYEYIRSELLTYPYKTNCRNYNHVNKQSRAHAMQSCFDILVYGRYRKLPKESLLGIDNEEPLLSLEYGDTSMTIAFDTFKTQCEVRFKNPDCTTELYMPYLVNTLRMTSWNFLGFEASEKPQIVTKSKPVIDIIDYVTYVLSCFSFWFAFSPLIMLTNKRAINYLNSLVSEEVALDERTEIQLLRLQVESLTSLLPQLIDDRARRVMEECNKQDLIASTSSTVLKNRVTT